jgi:hypothetical protein
MFRSKNTKMLPKTPQEIINGGVYLQRVRCGKRNCRCARGEHHEAHYFIYRDGGRQMKLYLRGAEVETMKELVASSRHEKRLHRLALRQSCNALREARYLLRSLQTLQRGATDTGAR